jgi:hypothetical protein
VDAAALHTDAGPDRVDPVVIGLYGNLGAFTRLPDDLFDHDESVKYLRNLDLQ